MTTTGKAPVRCIVVDHHENYRTTAAWMLTITGAEVLATTGTGTEAVRLTRSLTPDLVIVDVETDGPGRGFDLAESLSRLPAAPVVLMVTARNPVLLADRANVPAVAGCLAKDGLTLEAVTTALRSNGPSARRLDRDLRHK